MRRDTKHANVTQHKHIYTKLKMRYTSNKQKTSHYVQISIQSAGEQNNTCMKSNLRSYSVKQDANGKK